MSRMSLKKQQVCLELSRQIKEAGYPQEGLWWWMEKLVDGKPYLLQIAKKIYTDEYIEKTYLVAPTVAELGEALPAGNYTMLKNGQWMGGIFFSTDKKLGNDFTYANTEANARAKMWLYLKKKNLL